MAQAPASRSAFRRKNTELVVAGLLFGLGALVVGDSVRLGRGWSDSGPQPGYFPFYVGLLICAASLLNGGRALALRPAQNTSLVDVRALRGVLSVLLPTALHAAAIPWLGIYVASTLLVAGFMRWLGRYSWLASAAVGIGNSAVFFAIFELWFRVPLPKGPLEAWLGLN